MKLVDMKLDPKERKEEQKSMMVDAPLYPFGTSVDLDNEALSKLGMDELPEVGEEYTLMAKVSVTSVSSNQYGAGEKSRRVCLQITAMGLGDADADDSGENQTKKLYNS